MRDKGKNTTHKKHLAKRTKSTQTPSEKMIMGGNCSAPSTNSMQQFFKNKGLCTMKEVQSFFLEGEYAYFQNFLTRPSRNQ